MASSLYLQRPVADAELRDLAALAESEEEAFFTRNPHLAEPYRSRLLLAALCQGAALQYLGRGYGIKDFDIHYFYQQNPSKPRLSRTVLRIAADVGAFPGAPVDFIRTVIPLHVCREAPTGAVHRIRRFLSSQATANARNLAEKAAVGLWPPRFLGAVIWPPEKG